MFTDQPDLAAAAMRGVAGGRHPIYLLLSDWQKLALPPGATPWASQARLYAGMKKEEGWDYAELRVRTYVIAMPAAQVEAFYRARWPSPQLFEIRGDEEEAPGMHLLAQVFQIKGTTLEPAQHKKDVDRSPDKLPDGSVFGLVEMANASTEVRSKFPIAVPLFVPLSVPPRSGRARKSFCDK